MRIKGILIVVTLLLFGFGSAQIDTLLIKKDTLDEKGTIVEQLEKNRNKNKFNRFLHKIFVKRSSSQNRESENKSNSIQVISYLEAQGKPIRNIHVTTFDPFGYSLKDSLKQPKGFVEKAGNSLHIRTKKFVIKDYFLQKKNQNFDSVKIMESERLIRKQRFSREVIIDYRIVGENADSVDVYISTLDSWTIYPTATFSGERIGLRLRERNFMGLGHDFDNYYRQNYETGKNQFQARYTVPNIKNTFINFGVGYASNENKDYIKGVQVQRKFYSPITRWAGGVYIGQRAFRDSIPNPLGVKAQDFKYNFKDFWGGYAFHLFDEAHLKPEKMTNLVVAGRYFNLDYRKEPEDLIDPDDFYANQDFFLIGVGITKRGFVQDKFIRNYNLIEDIPIGMSVGTTFGMQRKNNRDRFYLASGAKYGDYFKFGYWGLELQYGSFLKDKKPEQSVFSLSSSYFTHLKHWGSWKFRGFINSNLIIGNNRANSHGDRLTLNENDPLGINGFNSLEVLGTKKWLTNIQLQSYSPYQFLGFRISPMMTSSIGLIAGEKQNLLNGSVFTKVGIGLLLTNDYLVFSNFQLSFSWYNRIPGVGENVFKANTFHISDHELMDFDFGKPELIEYSPYGVK